MAGKSAPQPQGGGTEGFFRALDALSYREHLEVAGLLAMQLEDKPEPGSASALATALADAADSFLDADAE